MKPMNFKTPLFPSRIRVFFSLDDFYAKYPEEQVKDATGFKAFVCEKNGIICLVLVEYSEVTLVHECVHVAWAVLNFTGVHVDYHNDEPLAYLVDHIFERVQKHHAKECTNG